MLGPFFQTPPPGHEKERRVAVKHHRAEELEARVWETVSGLLKEPERLRAGLEAMVEQERGARTETPRPRPSSGSTSSLSWTASATATRRWQPKT